MIEVHQGQTLNIERTITDNEGNVLTSLEASGMFAFSRNNEAATEILGTVSEGVFTVEISASVTSALYGIYDCEIKIKDTTSNEIGVVLKDKMEVLRSVIPSYGI